MMHIPEWKSMTSAPKDVDILILDFKMEKRTLRSREDIRKKKTNIRIITKRIIQVFWDYDYQCDFPEKVRGGWTPRINNIKGYWTTEDVNPICWTNLLYQPNIERFLNDEEKEVWKLLNKQ